MREPLDSLVITPPSTVLTAVRDLLLVGKVPVVLLLLLLDSSHDAEFVRCHGLLLVKGIWHYSIPLLVIGPCTDHFFEHLVASTCLAYDTKAEL